MVTDNPAPAQPLTQERLVSDYPQRARPDSLGEALLLPSHRCRKVAEAQPLDTGRDFDLLAVFGYIVSERHGVSERWLSRRADAFESLAFANDVRDSIEGDAEAFIANAALAGKEPTDGR